MRVDVSLGSKPEYFEELSALGFEAGLDAIGATSAEPFKESRLELERRRDAGLHGEMQFTFRNPERSTTPTRILPSAKSLIVGAFRTPAPNLAESDFGMMRVAAYARKDFYSELRNALGVVAQKLKSDGWKAVIVADDNALVDRSAAIRSGIGWQGKNGNVLIPGRGSWFVLGSVVTNASLPQSERIDSSCGSCQRCIEACPTAAIVAPGVVDARRCIAWLVQAPGSIPREFREAMGRRLYGCDDCQEVCPIGKEERKHEKSLDFKADRLAVDILEATDQELLENFGAWYIAERDPRYLRRNALVSIGNSTGDDTAVFESVLKKSLEDVDSLIRSHAVWSAARLGFDHLLEIVKNDSDPMVVEELTLLEEVRHP